MPDNLRPSLNEIEEEAVKSIQILWFHDFAIRCPRFMRTFLIDTPSFRACLELAKAIESRFPIECGRVHDRSLEARERMYGRVLALLWMLSMDYQTFRKQCLTEGIFIPLPKITSDEEFIKLIHKKHL